MHACRYLRVYWQTQEFMYGLYTKGDQGIFQKLFTFVN